MFSKKPPVIILCRAPPTTAAGRKAISTDRAKRLDCLLEFSVRATFSSRSKYSSTTAKMAPNWIRTVKVSHTGPLTPRSFSARSRCAVEETGRNSVRPSTTPRMIAFNQSFMETSLLGFDQFA